MGWAKYFLTATAVLYIYLALWCSFSPEETSAKVGFQRLGDTGGSEFLTVYGGLEFGLALVFLLPWLRPEWTLPSLIACCAVHGSLVLFRSIGFLIYPYVAPLTKQLAVGEWAIFLIGLAVLWMNRSGLVPTTGRSVCN